MEREVNQVIQFLAQRDIVDLTPRCLQESYGISKADAMFVFGNDLILTMECAAVYFQRNIAKKLVICGGVGHSTKYLRNRAAQQNEFTPEEVKNLSEAEIYGEIAVRRYGISREKILLDTQSTNSGANAQNGLQLMRENHLVANHVIVIQDPILQKRAKASLEQQIGADAVISFAPFLPKVTKGITFAKQGKKLWKKGRFLELLLGEIPRLRDDQYGYGPKGKNFIPHVEIPKEIEEAFEKIRKVYRNENQRKL